MAGKLIGIMFLSRDVAHREHLKTKSFAQHMALNTFYTDVVGLADTLAETWQGRHGIIKDIPRMNDAPQGAIDSVLETHLKTIEKNRFYDADKDDTAIQNIIDEIVGLYLTTLYKLRNLK
jgi:hypothetical protein